MLYLYWSTDADADADANADAEISKWPLFMSQKWFSKIDKKNKYLSYLSSKNSSVRIGNIPVIDESLWRCKKI